LNRSLIRSEVLPSAWGFGLLLATTVLVDMLLHALDLAWIGRWLGIPGTLLIVLSFGYSLRKRKLISTGSPARLLELHEQLTWIGALMVLVHAGVHVHAWLPWLALLAMVVNVASGYVGRLLLARSRKRVESRREAMRVSGTSSEDIERALYWDAVTLDAMKQWRTVHFPITTVFVVLSLSHIVSVLLLWGWW
jgi:hypothetical protein